MTVQFLRAWNGFEQFQFSTLAGAEETRLIGLGICRAPVDETSPSPVSAGGNSSGLSAVTYDGANKTTGFSAGGVTYAVTYPANQIRVTGSDASVQTINLDGSGRIASVA